MINVNYNTNRVIIIILSKFGVFRKLSHNLFDSKISHDFLTSSINTGKFESLLESLDIHSHPTPSNSSASENLTGLITDKTGSSGGLQLQQGNRSSEILVLLFVVHLGHLVCNVVQPTVDRFQLSHHVS